MLKPNNTSGFQVRRMAIFIITSVLYAFVTFQRTCPSIVAEEMAEAYHCNKADLTFFSSIYFYPYAIMQPFAGLLSDVMEPAYLITFSQITASVGAVICGLSKTITVGTIGRLLVGLGCGPTYVPVNRVIANWFKQDQFPVMSGILLAAGSVGGMISQGPLAALCHLIGWRNTFYLVGGTTFLLSILCLFIVRGSPEAAGYESVNPDSGSNNPPGIKAMFKSLGRNFLIIIRRWEFWVIVLYGVLSHGPYHGITGMWGGPYLRDVFRYNKQEAGNALIFISAGVIVGSVVFPMISTALRTRKWILLLMAVTGLSSSVVLFVVGSRTPYWALITCFFFFGSATMPISSVSYPLTKELYHPSVAGSAIGCLNFVVMLLGGVYQTITQAIMERWWSTDESGAFPEAAYRAGVWLVAVCSLGGATLDCFIMRDSEAFRKSPEQAVYLDLSVAEDPSVISSSLVKT